VYIVRERARERERLRERERWSERERERETHTETDRHISIQVHHPHRRLPQRELALLCPFETTIISPSYTSHHGIHHIIIKDILYV
jgi:hypothetical protein